MCLQYGQRARTAAAHQAETPETVTVLLPCMLIMEVFGLKRKFGIPDFLIYLFFLIFALIILLPLWMILMISFSSPEGYAASDFHMWSSGFSLDAYKRIFSNSSGILNGFWVSIRVTVMGTALSMVLTSLAGYVLSKKDLPGRNMLFRFVLFTMFFTGGLMPFYTTVRGYGLTDTIFAMFVPTAIQTYYVILMKNYFEGLPDSIEEAAKLDGANDIQILFKIIIPMSIPSFAAISLFYAVYFWNEYFYASLFVSPNDLQPLPVLLRQMIVQNLTLAQMGVQTMATNAEQFKMACIIVSIIPVLIAYPFVQKHFTQGLNIGAVKE